MNSYTTTNAGETQKIGEEVGSALQGGEVLCLYGDLGFGKTTFLQGIARGLGIEKRIISPTFVIMRTYEVNGKCFYHVDLYRIESSQDLENIGLVDLFNDPSAIVAIEWPEKLKSLMPKKRINITFEYIDENTRKITIKNEE